MFTRLHSDLFVGVDLPGDPLQNENFAQNSVNKCMIFYKYAILIFMYSRVAEGVDPYNRAGCTAINPHLSYQLFKKSKWQVDFF